MKTDLPLKRLTALRAADLLPLLGTPTAEVVGVETLELPNRSASLDTLLRLRAADGREYLHRIEWQGYADPQLLWRVLGYLAWLGQHRDERPILATIIYLKPTDDTGDTLEQFIDGGAGWRLQIPVVRLWELEPPEAVTSDNLALAVLSPLMRGARPETVVRAAQHVLAHGSPQQQSELLAILSVFAEPLIEPEQFIRLVGKEKLMTSGVLSILAAEMVAEKTAAIEAEKTAALDALDAERVRLLRAIHTLQRIVEDVTLARFPMIPGIRLRDIEAVTDAEQVRQLAEAILRAPDQATVEYLITDAARRAAE